MSTWLRIVADMVGKENGASEQGGEAAQHLFEMTSS